MIKTTVYRTCIKGNALSHTNILNLTKYSMFIQDEDLLSVYKIETKHTIHMVKGVARSSGRGSSSSSSTQPQQLPTMQAGQNVHDPLTQLNGHQGFGLMAGLNPFGEMGVNPNDPNMVCAGSFG